MAVTPMDYVTHICVTSTLIITVFSITEIMHSIEITERQVFLQHVVNQVRCYKLLTRHFFQSVIIAQINATFIYTSRYLWQNVTKCTMYSMTKMYESYEHHTNRWYMQVILYYLMSKYPKV